MLKDVDILWDRVPPKNLVVGNITEGLTQNTYIETRAVNDSPTVIISSYFESRSRLADILRNMGIESCYIDLTWPRDFVTSKGSKVILTKSHLECSIGGAFVLNVDGFGFSSTIGHNFASYITNAEAMGKFFGMNIFPIEPINNTHIDSDVTIIYPYVIVDRQSYHKTNNKLHICNETTFAEVAKDNNCTLIVEDFSDEETFKPLNCLVIYIKGRPFVIANSFTPKFLNLLKSLHIDYETVHADISPVKYNGSIRCRTNLVIDPELFTYLGFHLFKPFYD
ncbi:MAG: hypothetical protein UR28_C0039G0031 [Candidatus Peregrinibacteria bacterium GW2011_GWF2_33_10]|nr:MAG: hypothetical protein UR28_C0039G0031 [Candidatus Peregrinibacteria bacterium GW2011_GWF2_33_10]OGJ45934.1 MAG: hypothetical protein A2263_02235 [Candidatus Peregrinibacteria bacterium RIFOXYA2_FULL_33_21]OGJ46612.1 MAG: hypothetical protein A2272_02905 [Candidatus Peregrinibacteria bacterium RIFOXYA12_FULL_33_12]OGJ51524.1 MAG: hypothetical protein A2307_01020 [Candidatus Peregrinibacteria bacterium RIFOXYB2_FULL_33_20]